MANGRRYAVIYDGVRVLSGATYSQAIKVFDNMNLALSVVRQSLDSSGIDFELPVLVLCVDI